MPDGALCRKTHHWLEWHGYSRSPGHLSSATTYPIMEPPAHREDRQHCKQARQHYRKREHSAQNPVPPGLHCLPASQRRSAQAVSMSISSAISGSRSASRINRCRYAREILRLRAAIVLFPLFSHTATTANFTL